jgi:hypothetical protein
MMAQGFLCPVCGYNDTLAPPYADGQDDWYQEICPSCGTQFGYDDCTRTHHELRQRWLDGGARWWSPDPQPPNFNGVDQLKIAGLLD